VSTTSHETTHVGLGLLGQIHDDLAELVAYLRDDRLSFDVDQVYSLNWAAGAFADQELSRLYRGIAIFNLDAVNDLQVGFAAGKGSVAKRDFVISPRGYLTLPFLTAHVSVGGVGAGPAVVVALEHAPPVAGGRF
jgi:hypothetical protein